MKILIVVDMQNDFITGALGTKEAQAIVPNVVKKIREYIDNDGYILFTKDTHDNDYLSTLEGKKLPVEHCIQGTDGWLLEPSIADLIDKMNSSRINTIFKGTFGTFSTMFDIGAHYNPKRIESIELIGLCTDICVISNAVIVKTAFLNVPIIVDAACCAGSTPEAHKKALELMRESLQIDVINMEE